jgi:membrane protein
MKTRTDIGQFTMNVLARVGRERGLRTAASLAFTTLLALVPLLTVVVSVLSMFPLFEQWREAIEHFLYDNFVPAAGDTISQYLHEFSSQAGRLTAIGLIFLFLSALLLLATIEDAFNDIFRVRSGRSFLQRIVVYWAMITLGPLFMVASLSVTSYLLSLPIISATAVGASFDQLLLWALPPLFELLAFLLMYSVIPNRPIKASHAVIGALVATLLFEVAKRGFVVYMGNVTTYQVLYGALGVIPVFLIWLYISWLVTLFGGFVTAELSDHEASLGSP